MSKQLKKDDMDACLTFWISRCKGRESSKKLACGSLCTKDAIEQCKRSEKAIRRLIEKGSEVNKGTIIQAIDETVWDLGQGKKAVAAIIKILREAGVRVKEAIDEKTEP